MVRPKIPSAFKKVKAVLFCGGSSEGPTTSVIQTNKVKTKAEHADQSKKITVPAANSLHVEPKDGDAKDILLVTEQERREFLVNLSKRMRTCAQGGKFEAAVRDAHFMLEYAPTSPEAYIRLAELHLMEGKASKALKVYEMAIAKLPQSDVKHCTRLAAGKQFAAIQANARIDPAEKFSLEVLNLILGHLTFDERLVCLGVSRTWRSVLAKIVPLWLVMEIGSRSSCQWSASRPIMKHVKDLKLLGDEDDLVPDRLMSASRQWPRFPNVRSFTVRSCYIESVMFIATTIQSMPYLRELSVELNYGPVISFVDILSICPKLTWLRYWNLGPPAKLEPRRYNLPDKLCLETLTILNKIAYQIEIDQVLQRSPNMREVFLSDSIYSALEVVSAHCPNILALSIDPDNMFLRIKHHRVRPTPPVKGGGLQILEIGGARLEHFLESHQILPLIGGDNRKTLKYLSLNLREFTPVDTMQIIADPLYGGPYSNLSMLHMQLIPPEAAPFLASLLGICPMVSDVDFTACKFYRSELVFDALCRLKYLTSITLVDVEITPSYMMRFLDRCANRGTYSPITTLKLNMLKWINTSMVVCISAMRSLQVLHLERTFGIDNGNCSNMASALARLPDLRELSISGLPCFVPDLISYTGKFTKLRELTLGSSWLNSQELAPGDAIMILAKVPNLQILTFSKCSRITVAFAKELSRLTNVNCITRN